MDNRIKVIAEIGINHAGNMDLAREHILAAKECGCDFAKFQLYQVDAVFPDKHIFVQDKDWYEEVRKTQLTKMQFTRLVDYCREVGIEPMASVFDLTRLRWARLAGVKHLKIATRSNKDIELVYKVTKAAEEIYISNEAVDVAEDPFHFSAGKIHLLYCVPCYPALPSEFDFENNTFPCPWHGISDHSVGINTSLFAAARGAKIIEKHFTTDVDNKYPNPDKVCSIFPDEMKRLVSTVREFEEFLK